MTVCFKEFLRFWVKAIFLALIATSIIAGVVPSLILALWWGKPWLVVAMMFLPLIGACWAIGLAIGLSPIIYEAIGSVKERN